MPIGLKRIYDSAEKDDGIRVLVDRVWPRGVSKQNAQLDYWLKDIGPSNQLRKWFGHDPQKYDDFREKYQEELAEGAQQEALQTLKRLATEDDKQLTLLFSAKDRAYNQARVLKDILDEQ